ncbi:MAG: alpha-ketoglutarate-dependent dioxygenase AlkB [Methylococcaceae bacterium]|nr:alpha-ketoglutarate-dependent dioxygenase AlkB [Methylococcaceae bacterium]
MIDFNLGDGTVLFLYKSFYLQNDADMLFKALLTRIAWAEETIVIFGKRVKVPRLMCWYGEPDAFYRYSGVDHPPAPWIPELLPVKAKVEHQCRTTFNSVLANLYRDGKDSMGCHSDDEKELGVNPTIASLSLGDERLFRLHHKKTKQTLNIRLSHGDLLIMGGTCQQFWRHSVPKTKAHKTPRINLTFRRIETAKYSA